MKPPTIHRLSVRGATLLVLPDPSLPVVRFMFALRQGSVLDPVGKAGRGRVMLELLTRGTKKQSRAAWNEALEGLGSQVGASLGGELGFVRGITLARNAQATLELVREAVCEPAFTATELDDFKEELIEHLKSERDDDDSVAEIFLRRALYAGHLLSRGSAGEPLDVASLTTDDIRVAYKEHFSTRDMVIALAGDVTPDDAVALVTPLLQGLPEGPGRSVVVPEIADVPGLDITVADKPDRTQVQLRVGRLTLTGKHPDANALWLAVMAFGGTFTSPFTREVRDVRGWSYGAHAELGRRRLFRTPFVLRTAPAVGDALACLELELAMYRDVAAGKLPDEALDLARSYLLNRYPFDVASAADLLLPAVKNELLGLLPDELFKTPEQLESTSNDMARQALAQHLSPENVAVTLVATASQVVPELTQRFPEAKIRVIDFRDGLPEDEEDDAPEDEGDEP